MPLYEYQCHRCGKKFEVIQKFSDEALTTHPECGGPVEKLMSAPAFHLKGTGWYATDYAKSGSTGKKDDSKKDEPKAAETATPAAAETKTETKESTPAPAATTPTT